ncbi:ImmA/IrrE family metallo-endopeptidase [Rhodococcus sp. ARC_M12]|uniref:ImmA/IrrE family metallo-endopeptidase n=1 Tax=Rhodococcus sp. ARC_M12 TaxID=2928854 RepID=UPI001FB4365F|nr:ImmA/IrrE family metallo-endopeptidase [Rhodococcus sp. ARC_M12]MCJ0980959.1 ImmA/IrrE family metallo-endopeptidase [Rhodococcus sp. ARC_M12]
MVEQLAEVRTETWSNPCDALTIGLGTKHPVVFLRAGAYETRRRFTIAHEVGHLVIPWHVGTLAGCDTGSDFDASRTRSESRTAAQESEAQKFAGALLLPYSVAADAFASSTAQRALEELAKSGMSAEAFCLSITRYLLPGFVFTVEGENKYWSPGSNRANASEIDEHAHETGSFTVSGREVQYYRLASRSEPAQSVDDDIRTDTELLRAAVSLGGGTAEEQEARRMSLNGVVAGKLSLLRTYSPDSTYSMLMYHIGQKPDIPARIIESAEFERYLWRRVNGRLASLKKK